MGFDPYRFMSTSGKTLICRQRENSNWEFVYICCLKAEKDLTGFFRKWGFLTPVDVTVR